MKKLVMVLLCLRVIESEAFAVAMTDPVVIPAGVEWVQRGAFPHDAALVLTGESTHFETAEEYEVRVGYSWWGDVSE